MLDQHLEVILDSELLWPLKSLYWRARALIAGTIFGYEGRLTLAQLLLALATAFIAYRIYVRPEGRVSIREFLRYAVPSSIYRHASTRVDLKIYLFNSIVSPTRIVLRGVGPAVVGGALAHGLRAVLGEPAGVLPATTASIVGLGVLTFVVYDLSTYITHRLSHEVPLLWAFHRVHHSAEVLNPFTLMRKHPVYDLVGDCLDLVIVGGLSGAILYFWPPEIGMATTAVVGTCNAAFSCIAANLRHSHVWMSFGPVVSRVLVSPAMHQIHHSRAERHWNRNYGEVFSVWDHLFGSVYVPREREDLVFGLPGAEAQLHPTWWRAMVEPFHYAYGCVSDLVKGIGWRSGRV